MTKWNTIRRETGLIEHLCAHGVGHPNIGSMARMDECFGEGSKGSWGLHGCDGCCSSADFPGSAVNTLLYTTSLYRDLTRSNGAPVWVRLMEDFPGLMRAMSTFLEEVDLESIKGVRQEAERLVASGDFKDLMEYEILYYTLVALLDEEVEDLQHQFQLE